MPIVTPVPTDAARRPICSFEHLSTKVVSQEGAAAHTFIFVGISNTGPEDCDLSGPPVLMLLRQVAVSASTMTPTNAAERRAIAYNPGP
jgi:hypothetical protein